MEVFCFWCRLDAVRNFFYYIMRVVRGVYIGETFLGRGRVLGRGSGGYLRITVYRNKFGRIFFL